MSEIANALAAVLSDANWKRRSAKSLQREQLVLNRLLVAVRARDRIAAKDGGGH